MTAPAGSNVAAPETGALRPIRFALTFLLLLALARAFAASPNSLPGLPIGIEGDTNAILSRPDYRPRPLDDRTELILRIESVTPAAGSNYNYDFHYLVFEPGDYNLAHYLILPDGSEPANLAAIPVHVKALLPEDHDGQLQPFAPRSFPWIGGYRMGLGLLAFLWAAGIAGFVLAGRKKPVAPPPPAPPPPSIAERLRPLVEAAAAGRLTTEQQAQLERLLMAYWREHLGLPELRMAEALPRLKAHPEAGELLRALERWLHRPGGVAASEINALLERYRQPAPRAAAVSMEDRPA